MRNLKIFEHISLDGVIQHSADENDFLYSDWTAPYRTPAGRDIVLALYGETFDLLLGRRTYDLWSGFWPKAPSSPMSDRINAATKYVATHRPESLEWGPFEGLGPDIVEKIRLIKSRNGPDLILSGSSTLTSTLIEHGLADEILLLVYPVLLGKGKRIFAEGTPPRAFELTSTKALPSGIIISTYKLSGPLRTPLPEGRNDATLPHCRIERHLEQSRSSGWAKALPVHSIMHENPRPTAENAGLRNDAGYGSRDSNCPRSGIETREFASDVDFSRTRRL